jgi:hypothetical protein
MIKLQGEVPQAAPFSQFKVNLNRESFKLTQYKWEDSVPTNSPKGWNFVLNGAIPDAEEP